MILGHHHYAYFVDKAEYLLYLQSLHGKHQIFYYVVIPWCPVDICV